MTRSKKPALRQREQEELKYQNEENVVIHKIIVRTSGEGYWIHKLRIYDPAGKINELYGAGGKLKMQYLTLPEVAEVLGTSIRVVRKLSVTRKIVRVKHRGIYMIKTVSLVNFLAELMIKGMNQKEE